MARQPRTQSKRSSQPASRPHGRSPAPTAPAGSRLNSQAGVAKSPRHAWRTYQLALLAQARTSGILESWQALLNEATQRIARSRARDRRNANHLQAWWMEVDQTCRKYEAALRKARRLSREAFAELLATRFIHSLLRR